MTEAIVWLMTLVDARTEAARTGKPIVAVVSTENCTWCRKYERILDSDTGKTLLAKYVPVKLRPGDVEPRIRAVPTTVMFDSTGRRIASIEGCLSVEDLRRFLEKPR